VLRGVQRRSGGKRRPYYVELSGLGRNLIIEKERSVLSCEFRFVRKKARGEGFKEDEERNEPTIHLGQKKVSPLSENLRGRGGQDVYQEATPKGFGVKGPGVSNGNLERTKLEAVASSE